MKIPYPVILGAYLLPPVFIVLLAMHQGAVAGGWVVLGALFRSLMVALVAGAVTLGASESRHFQKTNGEPKELVLYLLYLVAFLVLGGLYGVELRFPDESQIGRYTF